MVKKDALAVDALTVEDLLGDEFEAITIQPPSAPHRPAPHGEVVATTAAAAVGGQPAGTELEHSASSHSTIRGMVAKICGGFASTAVTSIPSPNGRSIRFGARLAEAADAPAAPSAPLLLPLTQRKEMGLRALERAREAMIGGRVGRHWRQTSAARFGKREQPALGRGAERQSPEPAHAGFSWSAELDFVYDLLRSEEVHHLLAVADASWDSKESMRNTLLSEEAFDSLRHIFSTDSIPGEGAADVATGSTARLTATGGHPKRRSRRASLGWRAARRSMLDPDTCTQMGKAYIESLVGADEAALMRARQQIVVGDEEFSVFELHALVADPLSFVTMVLFEHHRLDEAFGIGFTRAQSFCKAINIGYRDTNAFHNRLHATDVAYAMHLFVLHSGVVESHGLEPLHVLAMLLGAITHDFRHPGVTNAHLISAGDPLALTYNDRSVLENFHAAETFKLLQHSQYNILHALDAKQFKELRGLVVTMILATDMAEHFSQVTDLISTAPQASESTSPKGSASPKAIERDRMLSILMHAADISHPFRNLASHIEFSNRIRTEFFAQGDVERKRKMEVLPMCDRTRDEGEVKFAQQQLGFLKVIVQPILDALCLHFPPLRQRHMTRLERTMGHWTQTAGSGGS